jgi:hypothetical protein
VLCGRRALGAPGAAGAFLVARGEGVGAKAAGVLAARAARRRSYITVK